MSTSIQTISIKRYKNQQLSETEDYVAVEEPLEISLKRGNSDPEKVSITMRTPGNDAELAAGFLFTEGIISRYSEITDIRHTQTLPGVESNTIEIATISDLKDIGEKLKRNFYTTSSCGVCGKASIDAIKTTGVYSIKKENTLPDPDVLFSLQNTLRRSQTMFEKTGGIHASALFSYQGELIALREDVGRHNALDKLIGFMLLKDALPAEHQILLLSGRASFELIQKAAMAGIPVVVAVGAPSSLAVETAQSFGIRLIGFMDEGKYNLYC